ncbi:DeoR family transcriptional regulator [Actinokineospora sp. 24-640]
MRRLAELLHVSEVTIRQDLRALDESGDVARVRGGARATRPRSDQREEGAGPGSAVGLMAAAFAAPRRRSEAVHRVMRTPSAIKTGNRRRANDARRCTVASAELRVPTAATTWE